MIEPTAGPDEAEASAGPRASQEPLGESLVELTGSSGPSGLVNEGISGLSLRTNFSWTLAGNVVYAGCQWGMLIILAHLGATPAKVGQFALAFTLTAPVIIFAGLTLRAVQATDSQRDYRFGDYFGLRLICLVIALITIAGIALFSNYPRETALLIMVIGFAKAFESTSDVLYGLFQQHELMDRISISMMIKGPFSLIALGLGTRLTHSVLWGSVGLAIIWALVLICYDIPNGTRIVRAMRASREAGAPEPIWLGIPRPRMDKQTLIRLARISLPLGFVALLVSLNTNMPRIYIERYLGIAQLGIFAALTYLMQAQLMVVSALGQSASPRMARHYAERDLKAFRLLTLRMLVIAAAIGGGGVLAVLAVGRGALTLFYGPVYAARLDVFVWLAIASGVQNIAMVLGFAVTAARCFSPQVPLWLLVVGVTTAGSLLLIPHFGLIGSAMALLAAAGVQVGGGLGILLFLLSRLKRAIGKAECHGEG